MRFVEFISEGRSKLVYEDDAIEAIRKDCQQAVQALLKDHALYRGVHNAPQFALVEPKKHNRVSKNTLNTYTLIIDNHPEWKKYPKRSKSIIMSTSMGGASPYGNVYAVFPKDGANYGICPTNDIWGSFSRSKITDLNDFNWQLTEFIPEKILKRYIPKPSVDSLFSLKKWLKELDEHIADSGVEWDKFSRSVPWMMNYKGDMWKLLNSILVPSKNAFRQTNDPMKIPASGSKSEVWTDQPSYMVSTMWLRDLENRDKLLADWSEEKVEAKKAQDLEDYQKWLGVK